MDEQKTTGTLYIVATPIGNSRDMSERGREILSTADIIAAEDTRRSVVLLNKLGIRGNSLSANHKFNEYGKAKWFIEQLASGKDIAVITDAGTPCISDPGNELIRAAVENGIRVVAVKPTASSTAVEPYTKQKGPAAAPRSTRCRSRALTSRPFSSMASSRARRPTVAAFS